jgi:sugar phosphate isomerase/epimerase
VNLKRLLNFSTHPGEPELFNDDWGQAEAFLDRWGFDGFELYPVGDYPCEEIPSHLVTGVHLRFFAILAPIWREDERRLMEIFGDWETVAHFYGGRDAEWITAYYARQLDLAHHLDCPYVVFHPVHCELENLFDWRFPWTLRDTLDLCAEVINAATRRSAYQGYILFENLWWPGSFRLDNPDEYAYLASRVDHSRCGIALDIGHLLNRNPQLRDEAAACDYLHACIDDLGPLVAQIHTVHLAKSLSGDYVRRSRLSRDPYRGAADFWERFDRARRHVEQIDQHDPFETSRIGEVVERLDPRHLVFEFVWRNMAQWESKIATQKKALEACLWPASRETSRRVA